MFRNGGEPRVLQVLFVGLLGAAVGYGWLCGRGSSVMLAVLDAAGEGVTAALAMAGGFAFFCGMIRVLRAAGAVGWLSKRLAPALRLLLGPSLAEDALEPVTMNLAANLLGMGNAATPMGLEAARRMAGRAGEISNALCMFLVINSSSVQALPTTVIALRAAAGSADPGAVILPTLAATVLSTVVGVAACKLMEKRA